MNKIFAVMTAVTIALGAAPCHASKILARVNKAEFTQADFDKILGALTPEQAAQLDKSGKKNEAIAQFIEAWVMEEVIKQEALKSGVDKKPEVAKKLEEVRAQVLAQAFIAEQVQPKITEATLEKEYEEVKKQFNERLKGKSEYNIRHIFSTDSVKIEKALARLKAGEDFLKVAREMSEDQKSSSDGGALGYVLEGASEDFDKALNSLKAGEYTKTAVKTENGYHIIRLDDKRKAKVPPFKEVKSSLQQRVAAKATQELVKKLRDKAEVEVNLP